MKRIKSIVDVTLDRLSDLPDSLIHHIFSFLEMRDVVKTTLLSKRWEYLWFTAPSLHFQENFRCIDVVKFRDFVNRALMLWRGTYLQTFSFAFFKYSTDKVPSDIDLWVLFAKDRKVEELCIQVYTGLIWDNRKLYHPPQCLYKCSSIRMLSLSDCNLLNCGNVQWNCLNTLELYRCLFSEDVINQIVSSPQLETFSLHRPWECSNMSIRSNSLKNLSIHLRGQSPPKPMVLTIWAPNLEALELSTSPCKKCLLKDVPSLREVNLEFSSVLDAEDGKALCQVLAAIQHAVTVKVSVDSFKLLGVMKGKYSYSHVKLLKINGRGLTKVSELVCLFDNFPKLEMLIIRWIDVEELLKSDADNNILSEANILKSNLLQLRIVKITWFSCNASMLQFIEFLLKHASTIEKIVIEKRPFKEVDSEIIYLVAQKVVYLQRSFPSVELVLC